MSLWEDAAEGDAMSTKVETSGYLGLQTIRRGKTAQCIQDIFTLHFPEAKTVLDVTYGKGRFWDWPHSLTIIGNDIDPESPCEYHRDYRALGFEPDFCDVLCFDPPFIFTPGINRIIGTKRFFLGAESRKSDFEGEDGNGARQRKYEAASKELVKPANPVDLIQHTRSVMQQAIYLARQGMIIKGQDLIVNKADWWSYNALKVAEELGIGLPSDSLIQHSPAHRMADPRWKKQYHFRRAHCFYFIWKW